MVKIMRAPLLKSSLYKEELKSAFQVKCVCPLAFETNILSFGRTGSIGCDIDYIGMYR
jgi:hypothetical protein